MSWSCGELILDSEWIAEPGDGTNCIGCGESCWLHQHRLEISIGGDVIEWEDPDDEIVLCASCWDVSEFGMKDQ